MSDKAHYDLDLLIDNPELCIFLKQCKFKDARNAEEVFLDTPYPAPYFLKFEKFMKIIKNPDGSPKGGAIIYGINVKELTDILAHALRFIPEEQLEVFEDALMGNKIDPIKAELNIKNVGVKKVHNGQCVEVYWKHFFLIKTSIGGDKLGAVIKEVKEQAEFLNDIYQAIEDYPEIKLKINAKHSRHPFSVDLTLGNIDTFSWRKTFQDDINYMISVYDKVIENKKRLQNAYSKFNGDLTIHAGPDQYFVSIKNQYVEFSTASSIDKLEQDVAKCRDFFSKQSNLEFA
tara:strand:- start:649 stop:1512 length:864 start_codon:yes stop_codon:yes gene_type:complete